MRDPRRIGGTSLLETVIALFLLAGAGLSVFYLFDRGIDYLGRASQVSAAVAVAENNLAELRSLAKDPDYYANTLPGLFGVARADLRDSSFTVRFDGPGSPRDSFSPSNPLEQNFPLDRQRVLEQSYMPVRCTVTWGASQQISLLTYIGQPPSLVDSSNSVRVRRVGPGGAIPPRQTGEFEAWLEDSSGARIPGVTFSLAVDPVSGNGTIDRDLSLRDGERVTVENKYAYNIVRDRWGVRPGEARMRAAARYNGHELVGVSEVFRFDGPGQRP